MLQRVSLILCCSILSQCLHAQNVLPPKQSTLTVKPPATTITQQQPQQAPPKPMAMKKLNAALEYAFIIDKPGTQKPQEGDVIKVNMRSAADNRLMYDSYTANKGKPVEFGMNKPLFKGDIAEAIALMSIGDSLVAQVDADAVYKNTKNKRPDFIKSGDKILYFIKLVGIKTKEQAQKEQQAAMNKQIQEQMAKQKLAEKKQLGIDDIALKNYFKKKGITPTKTASGLYYTITTEGQGENPKTNYMVKMNYTGTLLDGTPFDSNIDTLFKHTTPFEFKLGTGGVIKGWDEGVALLKKGSKATFYIPSTLAYGANARPGGQANPKGIPANSPLVFDVELLSFTEPVDEDAVLQKYFKEKNIIPTKTATGMYYKITQEGTGTKPATGYKVVMNYSGHLLDGTPFDSNIDTAFHHVQPFEFELGKHAVIRGWDEGVALLNKGTKATFYIPSAMGYGQQSQGKIPSNSILIFDVELMDIKPAAKPVENK